MGWVTLYLSMVLRMMEGVVKKVSRRMRKRLRMRQRAHQPTPCTERFSLGQRGERRGRVMVQGLAVW